MTSTETKNAREAGRSAGLRRWNAISTNARISRSTGLAPRAWKTIIAQANDGRGRTVTGLVNEWVDEGAALASLCAALEGAPLVAIDTEFVREKTYYPQLCVIQVATREHAACVDCLAPLDLAPLFELLFQPDCTWVLHSARQDLEVIWQRTTHLPPRLIDTQIG